MASGSKTSSSSTERTGGLSLSSFATQFLKNPIASVQREQEEEEEEEPVSLDGLFVLGGWGGEEREGEGEGVVVVCASGGARPRKELASGEEFVRSKEEESAYTRFGRGGERSRGGLEGGEEERETRKVRGVG